MIKLICILAIFTRGAMAVQPPAAHEHRPPWTQSEVNKLQEEVERNPTFGGRHQWKSIALNMTGRSPDECNHKWSQIQYLERRRARKSAELPPSRDAARRHSPGCVARKEEIPKGESPSRADWWIIKPPLEAWRGPESSEVDPLLSYDWLVGFGDQADTTVPVGVTEASGQALFDFDLSIDQ
ncbi:MAG: SANT/Myb domain-containing protein [Holosporales bacterium]|jgi:hypothetical protein|nr:SANT/Myb domain-containing protein [Holosporales bacterium]